MKTNYPIQDLLSNCLIIKKNTHQAKLLVLFIFALLGLAKPMAYGQDVLNMHQGTDTVCDVTYYDPGGENGNYPLSNIVHTVYPASPGTMLQVTFSEFSLVQLDHYLEIYDGTSTNAPLIGAYTWDPPVAAIATNPEGALTFRLRIDRIVSTRAGWKASLTCHNPNPTINTFSPTSGYPLTEVTIEGDGFLDVTDVQFNGISANSFEVINATTIKAKTPIQGSTGNITVVNNSGSANSSTAFTHQDAILMSTETIYTCGATYMDPGGAGKYPASDIRQTIHPETAGKLVQVTFYEYDAFSPPQDVLVYYDGIPDGTNGAYYVSGNVPLTITATNPDGILTFSFRSWNGFREGWRATISCIDPPLPEIPNFEVQFNEDEEYTFSKDLFSNQMNNLLGFEEITITSLPDHGQLKYQGGNVVSSNAIIPADKLNELSFKPDENWNGSTTFTCTAKNWAGVSSTAGTITLTALPVNDAPIISTIETQVLCGTQEVILDFHDFISDVDHTDGSLDSYIIALTPTVESGAVHLNDLAINYDANTHLASLQHHGNTEGVFTVELAITDGAETVKKSFSIMAFPPPNTEINLDGNVLTAPANGSDYQWYKDGTVITQNGNSRVYVIKQLGSYHVSFTSQNGCQATSEALQFTALRFNDISTKLQLYPNPSSELLNLTIEDDYLGEITINIRDITGKAVKKRMLTKNERSMQIPLSISKLTNGLYLVELTYQSSKGVIRFVKE